MELTGGADCGATGGDENSRMIVGEVAHRGNVRVERLVRPDEDDLKTRERARMLGLEMRMNMKPQKA